MLRGDGDAGLSIMAARAGLGSIPPCLCPPRDSAGAHDRDGARIAGPRAPPLCRNRRQENSGAAHLASVNDWTVAGIDEFQLQVCETLDQLARPVPIRGRWSLARRRLGAFGCNIARPISLSEPTSEESGGPGAAVGVVVIRGAAPGRRRPGGQGASRTT